MADTIVSNLVEFKLRRTPAGVQISVTSTPEFEASLKSRARGEQSDRPTVTGYVDTHNIRECPSSDQELGWFLYMVGTSPGGKTATVTTVRSRDQLVKCAEEVANWVERHFSTHMRAVEVTATVKARTIFGLSPEVVS